MLEGLVALCLDIRPFVSLYVMSTAGRGSAPSQHRRRAGCTALLSSINRNTDLDDPFDVSAEDVVKRSEFARPSTPRTLCCALRHVASCLHRCEGVWVYMASFHECQPLHQRNCLLVEHVLRYGLLGPPDRPAYTVDHLVVLCPLSALSDPSLPSSGRVGVVDVSIPVV